MRAMKASADGDVVYAYMSAAMVDDVPWEDDIDGDGWIPPVSLSSYRVNKASSPPQSELLHYRSVIACL